MSHHLTSEEEQVLDSVPDEMLATAKDSKDLKTVVLGFDFAELPREFVEVHHLLQ